MAGSVNKVILLGNLGRDPDIRTMQNGKKVCSFSIATSDSWKDKDLYDETLNSLYSKFKENYKKYN